jgi:hypothetical protein
MGNDGKNPAAVELGRKGGIARAERLSKERRREIAVKASQRAAEERMKRAGNHE